MIAVHVRLGAFGTLFLTLWIREARLLIAGRCPKTNQWTPNEMTTKSQTNLMPFQVFMMGERLSS